MVEVPLLPSNQPITATAPEFRSLFDAEVSWVRNTLRRLGVREDDLDDGVVETFVAVHAHLSEYDPVRPLRPWLFGFALRIAAVQRRRNARRGLEQSLDDQPVDELADSAPTADETLAVAQVRQQVILALDGVELERRAVLVLHDLDGQPMPEIAKALGIPLNTGYSRLRLARDEFAAAMRRIQARGGRAR